MNELSDDLKKKGSQIRASIAELDYIIGRLTARRKAQLEELTKLGLGLEVEEKKREVYPEIFQRHWNYYREKTGRDADKKKAFTAWKKVPAMRYGELVRAMSNYTDGTEKQYCREMFRFLREDFWPTWIHKVIERDKKIVKQDARSIAQGVFKK